MADLDTGHPTGEVGGRVAVGDVGDQLQSQLLEVEHSPHRRLVLVGLHRLLHLRAVIR